MAYGRAISKAVKQAGKQQQANTRGLSGNRNAQGDFMPEKRNLEMQFSPHPEDVNEALPTLKQLGKLDNITDSDLESILSTLKQEREFLRSKMNRPGGDDAHNPDYFDDEDFDQLAKVEDAINKVESELNTRADVNFNETFHDPLDGNSQRLGPV